MTKETKKADAFRRQVVVKQLDDLFSIYIRLKTARDFGSDLCPICLKRPIQCCFHWVRRGHHKVRWDEGNTTGTCNGCNKGMNHDPHSYWQWFRRTYGTKAEDELIARSKGEARFSRSDLLGKLVDFKTRVENFKKNRTLVMEDKKPDNLAERNMKNRRGEEADRIADKKALVWHTEKRKISGLIPCDHNPRQMTGEQAEQLKQSIEKFNFVEIPAVNTNGTILAGHQRLRIMQMLGRGKEEIDIRIPNRPLTQAEADEYMLRSNKNIGEWDFGILANFDDELLKDIGFSADDMDSIFQLDSGEDGFDTAAEYEKVKKSNIKTGDLFQFKNHRLMCGDSTKSKDMGKLMAGKEADMVFTDPPFNVDYEGMGKLGKIQGDNQTEEQFIKFAEDFMARMSEATKKGGVFYICSGYSSYPTFLWALRKNGFHFSTPIIWVKNNTSLGWGDYRHKHEMMIKTKNPGKKKKAQPILYGWNGGKHYFIESRFEADVWEIRRRASNTMVHPTQKPLELVGRAIRNSSQRGEIVLDLFGGSGSTLISAEKEGRQCYMMEKDPKYCQVIINRFKAFQLQKPQEQIATASSYKE